jgi:hypothetical protein
MLYLAAQDKLDGQLFISTAIKYRVLAFIVFEGKNSSKQSIF